MTPRRKTTPKKPFDPAETAARQVEEYLTGRDRTVSENRKRLAVQRHTQAVRAASKPVDLDWHTRQYLGG